MALSQATITVYCQICINIYTRCRIRKKWIWLYDAFGAIQMYGQ